MTYSIAAKCEKTGALGAAITTSSIAVTSRCLWIETGVGVVLSQNVTDPRLGLLGLAQLRQGFGAQAVLSQLCEARPHTQWRQLAVLDTDGHTACFTGARALGIHATATGPQCVAAGNLLARDTVPQRMIDCFLASAGQPLPDRLLAALQAGLDEGGETGDERSAGLVVHHQEPWPVVDLRVDWADDPITELSVIWKQYAPQMNDYIQRAKHPDQAPAFDAVTIS